MIIFVTAGIIAAIIVIQRFIYIIYAFKNLSLTYDFSQTEVSEGDIFYITEVIENKKYLPLPAVSTILEAGQGLAFADGDEEIIEQKNVFCFYTVGVYKKITRTWRMKAVMRGRYNINNITVSVRDIFGLVKITKDFSCGANILILPSAYNTDRRISSLNLTGGSRAVPTGYYSNPFEVQKILPYTYREPLNRINWKASAKSRSLMANVEQPAVSERILIILDTSEKQFVEKNIKICATLKKVLWDESELTFVSNGKLPEDYFNPLPKISKKNNADNNYIQTQEFNLNAHERNFRRLLAEILAGDYTDKIISAEDLAEKAGKNMFCNSIIMVKGGKIYDYETAQTIFV